MYRCPSCRIVGDFAAEDGLESWKKTQMKNPHGNQRFRTGDGKVKRVQVRGLIYCNQCHVQWPRDFSASVNIGWVFVHAISTGSADRPSYLQSWWDDLKKKHKTQNTIVAWREDSQQWQQWGCVFSDLRGSYFLRNIDSPLFVRNIDSPLLVSRNAHVCLTKKPLRFS